MNPPRTTAPLLLLLGLAVMAHPADAAWPHDPNSGNVAVTTATGAQESAQAIPDGAGGMIVVWHDQRGAGYDIYVQRISAAGVPLWTANGVALSTATDEQSLPQIVSDGAGGAIVCWNDRRGGTNYDIYARRINAAGVPQWTANGVAVCTASLNQLYPTLTPDGAGGAIITWLDSRNVFSGDDIYAQRLNSSGVAQWTANGVAVCTATLPQIVPKIASDGAGGAIVAWDDLRGATRDLYAQRISSSGSALWTANGVAVCTTTDAQYGEAMISDGAGGAILTWNDYRSGTNFDVYAQRLTSAGGVSWTIGGVLLYSGTEDQVSPRPVSDGAGGAIVAFIHVAGGVEDVLAQRIGAAGALQWAASGVSLCSGLSFQDLPAITTDGAGGAIVLWRDWRNLIPDIYAQRISGSGVTQWTANGVAVCTALGSTYAPVAVSDGAGGAIAAWEDARNGADDIYAQRIEKYGQLGNPEPSILSVSDVENDQGGMVKVAWSASYLDVDPTYGITEYRVFRSIPGPFAAAASAIRGVTTDSDEAVSEGRLLVRPMGAQVTSWEYVGSHAAETFAQYSRQVTTSADSVGGSNPRTYFMVEARATTSLSSDRWFSAPDSGYSVDNLPPAAPAPLTGQYLAGSTSLHWNRNLEPDLAGYRLYRGATVSFVPDPSNLVTALPDTGYADAAGAPYVYKLTAVDSHGNESPVATLVPSGTLGADAGPRAELGFAAPSPNPARGSTTLRFTTSRAGHVRLALYDAAGRRVQLVQDGELAAGTHEASLTLSDASGRALPSGLYLARLEAEGRVLTRRVAAVR